MSIRKPHVIIVGAGIVGASLSYHLACLNAQVTLIDKASWPAGGVTGGSFAWITAVDEAPEAYLSLRRQAIADWHRVELELRGQLKIDWSGSLSWYQNSEEAAGLVSKLRNNGFQAHLIGKKHIQLLEPNLKNVPAEAMFAKGEGTMDAKLTTEIFVNAALEKGAGIQLGNEFLSFITSGSRIVGVKTANGPVTADVVVLAAGAATQSLCQSLNIALPVTISPAILMRFYTDHRFVNHIVSNPLMEIHSASDKLTLASEDYIDESKENNKQAVAERTLRKINEEWHINGHIKLGDVTVGQRPMPQDGLPVIGRVKQIENLYLLVMHSGVTLAAIAGRLAACEIMTYRDEDILSPYRLKRFELC